MTTSEQVVQVEEHGEVLHLVMERPPANALGAPLLEGLEAALDVLERGGAKVLVVSSAVPGFFAAGADLKYISTLDASGFERYRDALRAPIERLASCGRPSIAAIDGLALGGGLELAMACTLRVATIRSRMGLPEVKLGLIPGAGGTQRLPRLVGHGRALQIMLSGREVGAGEAADIGLVDILTEADAVECAFDQAGVLARWPAAAMDAIISCVEAADRTPALGMTIEGDRIARLFAEGHADAGITTFLGRRSPSASESAIRSS
jgi:enoyl-CoA hydratase